jgi:hypothetical protein
MILGVPAVGSRAHHPRLWWTNMAPAELLQSAMGHIQWPDAYVNDILDPDQAPRRVYHNDQVPLVVVNRRGEPRRALPTLVSFARSYAFKDNGPGLVWDSTTQEMVEPNANEHERAMGFSTGATQVPSILEQQRRFLLGHTMDLNCLTWTMSLVVVEQKRLASSLVGHMGFYELRSAMEPPHFVPMTSKVVGGERASIAHPWDLWDARGIFLQDKAQNLECHGQSSQLVHPKMDLEEYIEKIFFEEHTTYQMEEIWRLSQIELCGMVGLEEVAEPSSSGIQ